MISFNLFSFVSINRFITENSFLINDIIEKFVFILFKLIFLSSKTIIGFSDFRPTVRLFKFKTNFTLSSLRLIS